MSGEFVAIYTPIEIEIEGVKYKLRKLNRARFREIAEWTKKEAEAGDDKKAAVEAVYEQLKVFVDAPADVLDDLDIFEVGRLVSLITEKIVRKPASPEDPEKNVPKPGGDALPQ